MVEISVVEGHLLVKVQGIHRLWALKSSLRVPLTDVMAIRHDPERAKRTLPGFRFPGTHIPKVYTAGTYYQRDRRPDFWAVRHPEQAVVIQCVDGAAYDEIIVEVLDPTSVVSRVQRALDARR